MDIMMGAGLDDDEALDKVRTNIMKFYADNESSNVEHDQPRGLHAGKVLEMDDDGMLGLGEAPLSM